MPDPVDPNLGKRMPRCGLLLQHARCAPVGIANGQVRAEHPTSSASKKKFGEARHTVDVLEISPGSVGEEAKARSIEFTSDYASMFKHLPAWLSLSIWFLDQQPVAAASCGRAAHAHQRESTAQDASEKHQVQVPGCP